MSSRLLVALSSRGRLLVLFEFPSVGGFDIPLAMFPLFGDLQFPLVGDFLISLVCDFGIPLDGDFKLPLVVDFESSPVGDF